MEIILAENAGFCFGVQRAIDEVERCLEEGGRLFTYGPIIHNTGVVEDLKARGVGIVDDASDLKAEEGSTVVIRSHGVPRSVIETLEGRGVKIADATCPFVKRIHGIVEEASAEGRTVIVIGSAHHPEVEGITGWADGEVCVVETAEEANRLSFSPGTEATVVVQTTFNANKYKEIVEILSQKGYNINVANTICSATKLRQTEARQIAERCDAVLVIGDEGSSNTRKLYEICARQCARTYLIATAGDLKPHMLDGVTRLGITAGASAPKNIIEEVQTHVRTRSDV